jgi:hypothetical protein
MLRHEYFSPLRNDLFHLLEITPTHPNAHIYLLAGREELSDLCDAGNAVAKRYVTLAASYWPKEQGPELERLHRKITGKDVQRPMYLMLFDQVVEEALDVITLQQ